jgi:hypothetical protein
VPTPKHDLIVLCLSLSQHRTIESRAISTRHNTEWCVLLELPTRHEADKKQDTTCTMSSPISMRHSPAPTQARGPCFVFKVILTRHDSCPGFSRHNTRNTARLHCTVIQYDYKLQPCMGKSHHWGAIAGRIFCCTGTAGDYHVDL